MFSWSGNRSELMAVPAGVTKATGLRVALRTLGSNPHNTLAIGDAENDLAMLADCEVSVAVANAVDSVRAVADITTTEPGSPERRATSATGTSTPPPRSRQRRASTPAPIGAEFSRWLRHVLHNDDLAAEVAEVEELCRRTGAHGVERAARTSSGWLQTVALRRIRFSDEDRIERHGSSAKSSPGVGTVRTNRRRATIHSDIEANRETGERGASRVWQLVDLDGRCDVGVVGMVVDDVVTNLVVVDEAQLAVGAGMRSFVHTSMIDTVKGSAPGSLVLGSRHRRRRAVGSTPSEGPLGRRWVLRLVKLRGPHTEVSNRSPRWSNARRREAHGWLRRIGRRTQAVRAAVPLLCCGQADEADSRDATLVVVHVWSYPYVTEYASARGRDLVRVDAALVLEDAVRQARERCRVDVEEILVEGVARDELVACSEQADLVVVGTRGHGAVRAALLGSVANSVAVHAAAPVVVIRPLR